jgi:hypothetical protein
LTQDLLNQAVLNQAVLNQAGHGNLVARETCNTLQLHAQLLGTERG